MKKNAGLVAKILAAIFVIAAACSVLAACTGNGGNNGMSSEEWKTVIEAFTEATGGTDEVDVIASNFSAFGYADGKYTAELLTLGNGFTMHNIVVETENGTVKSIKYELRTESLDTPDRIITIDENGVNSEDVPKPSDSDKMDEDEWKEQVEIFANVTNYTLARTRDGALVGAMKLDGTKYYDIADDYERVFTMDGGKYYRYGKATDESVWTRREVQESSYIGAVAEPAFMVSVAADVILEGFSEFAFDKGIYTTEELFVPSYEITLRDIKVTISGKAIVKVICTYVGGYDDNGDELITVDHVGSTVVTVPANYNESQPSQPQPPTPDGSRLSIEKWTAAVDEFVNSTNFTTVAQMDYASHITRRSGDTVYIEHIGGDHTHEAEYAGIVYTKEGESYVKWSQQTPADEWVKTNISQAEYDEQMGSDAQSAEMVASVLIDSYDLFTFQMGLYMTEKNIDVGASVYLANLMVFVGNGQIMNIGYTIMYRMGSGNDKNMGNYVIGDIGSTAAFNPATVGSVSGKSFVCNGLYPAYGVDPDNKEQNDELNTNRQQNNGLTVTFGDDYQFRSESGPDAMLEMIGTGTWSQQGAVITVTLSSMSMNGENMNIPGIVQYTFTYNGYELVQVVNDDKGAALYYSVYTRQ